MNVIFKVSPTGKLSPLPEKPMSGVFRPSLPPHACAYLNAFDPSEIGAVLSVTVVGADFDTENKALISCWRASTRCSLIVETYRFFTTFVSLQPRTHDLVDGLAAAVKFVEILFPMLDDASTPRVEIGISCFDISDTTLSETVTRAMEAAAGYDEHQCVIAMIANV